MSKHATYLFVVALHILIGVLIYLNESLAKVYFFSILLLFSYRIIFSSSRDKVFEVLKACAYMVGVEVLMRATRGAISYEAGKYVVILFILMGFLYKGMSGKGYPYFIYILFLIPSIFVASTTLSFDANFRTNIAFVLSGPLCLGFAALFCYNRKVTYNQLSTILLYMLLPIIAHTAYIYIHTPNVKEVISSVVSNSAASGGFGPNQVSAILGLGVFITVIRLLTKSSSLGFKIINIVILGLISFRAIATLSRGGVLTAFASILVFLLFFYFASSYKKRGQVIGAIAIVAMSLIASWIVSSNQTGGITNLRYANKDHLGREKADLTTGRLELFNKELEGFLSNPFLGIGSSRAKDQRIEIDGQGVTSHSEFSRTLAEHGLLLSLIHI